jgi:Uma2 family endonuclease
VLREGLEALATDTAADAAVRGATVDDLYRYPKKAELVGGRLKVMEPTGFLPNQAAGAIYASLRAHARSTGAGFAIADNAGFLVDLPHRQSFSPDAAFHTGPPTGMKFLAGAPVFAVEVRSENDYGPAAERELAAKRADYFAAGTKVVWDVDLLSDDVVRAFRGGDSQAPAVVFRRGETADAEPAVPGWRMPVDELFD